LLESVNDWSAALDKNQEVLILFVDFCRAFDSVSIPKLIYKLELLGVSGKLLLCISSLLTNRIQQVRVGDSLSSLKSVSSGVQQGSKIGPILFILFINDLISSLPHYAVSKLFAGDFKSYAPISGVSSVNDFKAIISSIEHWANIWQLPLSVEKCSYMILSNRICKTKADFLLCDRTLDISDDIKDLGVSFNSCLNFSGHLNEIISKAKQIIYLLRKCFFHCDEYYLILAYKIYVIPILVYCSTVWSPSNISDICRVESVQRGFTKSLKMCNLLSYNDRLTKCNLCTLEYKRLLADLTLFYKMLNNHTVLDFGDQLKPCSNSITRGHSRRFIIPRARINCRHHSYLCRTIPVWNSLSENTVNASSVKWFEHFVTFENLSKFLII